MRVFPSDGVRAGYSAQSWRMTGRVIASDGVAFSYAALFFRYVEPNGVVLYPASISVVDESSGRFFSERRIERAGLGLAEAAPGALDIRVGTWHVHESPVAESEPAFDLDAKLADVTLTIHGIARKPKFVARSATAEHDEYSSISCDGQIAVDGRARSVRGEAWLDHQMANSIPSTTGAFAQFRVQLDDGREIFIDTSGSPVATSGSSVATSGSPVARLAHRSAYLVERNGTVDTLRPGSYEFGDHPGSTWLSPHTRLTYPDVWGLHVDGKTEFLSLEPVSYDQESLARGDGLSYWDGAVDVYDVTPGSQGRRLGSGYVLMLGHSFKPNDS
jgi:predicted secreted hydrolase